LDEFVVERDRSMEQREENVPDGLAGRLDFREFRSKGAADELSAGTKRRLTGGAYD
jgi:hypothetical protein